MGIFTNFIDPPPGPGIRPDAPRQTGLLRFLEVLFRDFGKLYMAGLLAVLGLVPYAMGLILAIGSHAVLPTALFAAIGGMVAGPQLMALTDRVLRSLRDDPNAWWMHYCRVWKRDWMVSLLPGAVTGVIVGMQLFVVMHLKMEQILSVTSIFLLLGAILSAGICQWIWVQIPVQALGFGAMVKNAFMIAMLHLPRTLGAGVCWVVYVLLVLLLWPFSQPVLLVTQLWLPALAAVFLVYKPCDEVFEIEESLKNYR